MDETNLYLLTILRSLYGKASKMKKVNSSSVKAEQTNTHPRKWKDITQENTWENTWEL